MTRAERKVHRRHVLKGAADELASHPDNGSEWLFPDLGEDEPGGLSEEVRNYRVSVLEKLVESIRRSAA